VTSATGNSIRWTCGKLKNGEWKATAALGEGQHEYRYLVDGQWRDDPIAGPEFPTRSWGKLRLYCYVIAEKLPGRDCRLPAADVSRWVRRAFRVFGFVTSAATKFAAADGSSQRPFAFERKGFVFARICPVTVDLYARSR